MVIKPIAQKFFSLGLLVGFILFFGACGKKEKTIEEMSFKELVVKVDEALEMKRKENAIPFLEQLVAAYPEHQQIADYKLKLADLYLKDARHEAAFVLYENFGNLYPSHPQASYAHYQQILAKFYQTLKISESCDSSLTEQVVTLCSAYLENPVFKEHRQDVTDIESTCHHRLLDKEVYVFSSYLRQGKMDSAKSRLAYLKEKYSGEKHKDLEPRLLYLECKLAHKEHNQTQESELFNKLADAYPESEFTHMAQGFIEHQRPTGFIA